MLPTLSPILASAEASFITSLLLSKNEIGCAVATATPFAAFFFAV
jgi:hypothetical protein